ncbi:unnamed protein product [Parnassius mnemosyne]|uniref:Attacin C-terminal domain-containing protein n=1 Tax=Parnassius mnemosyne TaxID=213953 RepID=A0AAV1L2V1_9NEOP
MPIEFNGTEHLDKSKDVSIIASKGNDNVTLFGSASIDGYKENNYFPKPTGPTYNSITGSVGVINETGHSASVTARHIPNFGNQVTAATNLNVLKTDNHKVDVNAFTTKNFTSAPIPNFSTHGAGVNYQYKDVAQAAASVAHTPLAQRTDYAISTGLKLHETPASSLSVNVGASKFDSPFTKGNWQPNGFLQFQKRF